MLRLELRTVRSWVERGKLESVQLDSGLMRRVPVQELARLEAKGHYVDWGAALE